MSFYGQNAYLCNKVAKIGGGSAMKEKQVFLCIALTLHYHCSKVAKIGGDMEIIEQSIIPKTAAAKPEDGIVVTHDFIAVIDGSTSKSPTRISRWRSNGRYCMQLIGKYVKRMPKETTANAFCKGVTAYVAKHYKRSQMERLAEHPEERMAASCVVYSRLQRQIWMVGDCQCLVGGQLYDNHKPYELPIAEERAETAKRLIGSGEATVESLRQDDIARKAILPRLIASMKEQNKGYAVVDGFAIPMSKVRIITLDFRPWTIVLATDGYPFLKPTLAESEAELKRQAENDPLNIETFKATKGFAIGANSFDDRSYIRFKV